MKPDRSHISIIFEKFACEPDAISELMGLSATFTAMKDQEYEVGPKHNRIKKNYKCNIWQFREVYNESTWISDLVSKFVNKHIVHRKEIIKQILSECEGELSVIQYIYEGSNPGLHFKKEEIEMLGYIGLELDIDLYCLAEE